MSGEDMFSFDVTYFYFKLFYYIIIKKKKIFNAANILCIIISKYSLILDGKDLLDRILHINNLNEYF